MFKQSMPTNLQIFIIFLIYFSFPVLSSIMKAKRTGSTHKSAMEALYNHPDLQKGQRENSFLDAWKSDFKEKPASDFRQKEEETELMKVWPFISVPLSSFCVQTKIISIKEK